MSEPLPPERDRATVSDGASGAGSPSRVPTTRRAPAAKTAAGASVIGSTTRSPRMPWAFRRRLAHGHGVHLAPGGDAALVAHPEDAGTPQERPHGVAGQRTDSQPVVRA